MNDKNIQKVELAKRALIERNIIFKELPNGQFQVDTSNFWATSEKWYDANTDTRGKGINGFIKYLQDKGIVLSNLTDVEQIIQKLQSIKNDPSFKATLNTHEALTKAIDAVMNFKKELQKDTEAE